MGQRSSQRIRYLKTTDGIRLAWADAGTGPAVVKASNWLTHLEYEWESPVWAHWMRFFSSHFRDSAREYHAIVDLIRAGWERDNPAFRSVFTSRFVPDATDEQLAWFNDLCRKTATAGSAAAILESRADIEVMDLLSRVSAPTLVLHAREDAVTPISQGRLLAAGIRGAEFVELDSNNHILLEHEPAWKRFMEAVLEFVGMPARAGEDPAFEALSPREREILALISEGLGNADIGQRLSISEKTVRNHVSNLFDKLGVWSRAQAIVFARDHGFSAPEGHR